MDCIICRYSEIALKGKNRDIFEKSLVHNLNVCIRQNKISGEVKRIRGRIFVLTKDAKALSVLKDVFGIVSISPAVSCDNDIDAIKTTVIDSVSGMKGIKTFRISSKRTNKDFPKSSHELDVFLGDAVNERFGWKVDLTKSDLDIGVDIQDRAYIFHEKVACFGGLPVGVSGVVACLIEKEQDLAAAWLMMKRGCSVYPVSFIDFDISLLKKYSYGIALSLTRIKDISEMNAVVDKNRCKAVIVGSLLEDFEPERYSGVSVPVLTPLIGMGEKTVAGLLSRIR